MATGSLLALLDDIASVLDDVALLSKAAAKKTAGVLGDDLALNAQQVAGVRAERELPVVWAVAKGSLLNKAILVPAALAISAFAPWAVTPLLMLGGAYLCFEGAEKLAHRYLHRAAGEVSAEAAPDAGEAPAQAQPATLTPTHDTAELDLLALEKQKIRGAVRTDFILSAEIIAISLGTVADAPFITQVTVLVGIALLMTVGVYGLVAGIVKLDDLGLWLSQRSAATSRALGRGIVNAAPWLMKGLSVAGTVAMFLVGGGILVHGVPPLQQWLERSAAPWGTWGTALLPMLANAAVGLAAGLLLVAAWALLRRLCPAVG